jgi:hypothetical protein
MTGKRKQAVERCGRTEPSKRTLYRRAAEQRAQLGLPPRRPGRPRLENPSPAALRQRACRARKAEAEMTSHLATAHTAKPRVISPRAWQPKTKIAA